MLAAVPKQRIKPLHYARVLICISSPSCLDCIPHHWVGSGLHDVGSLLQGLTLDKWLKGLLDLRAPFDCADTLRAAGYTRVKDIVTAGNAYILSENTGLSVPKAEVVFASAGEK